MNDFLVRHFSDYHEIEMGHPKYKNYIEIGCFPVERYGCCRYFGVFYNERKPNLAEVWMQVKEEVVIGDFEHYRTHEDIGKTEEEIVVEIDKSLEGVK